MRNLFVPAFVFVLATLTIRRQIQAYLTRVPSLPGQPCSLTKQQKDQYLEKVNLLSEELRNETDSKKETVEKKI